ncbi:MAG: DUF1573 domain-containing protein [Flammeovirgaceae bacterium]
MTRILLLFVGLFFITTTYAQFTNVSITKDSVYLGRLSYQNTITHSFQFVVKNGRQAQVKEVKADCACSILSYPEYVLRSGQEGNVNVEFDPYKPGPFEKRFYVSWEGSSKVDELILKGYIEPTSIPAEQSFSEKWGNLRLKRKIITFGNVPNQDVVKRRVEVYNPSSSTITFKDTVTTPKYMEVVWEENELKPQGKLAFDIYLNPKLKNDFGFSLDNLVFYTNHPVFSSLSLDVSSIVYAGKERTMSKEIPKQPKIWVGTDTLSLGKIFSNNSFVVSFIVYNKGKDVLKIDRVVPDVNCEIISIDKKELKAEEYTYIKVKVSELFKQAGMQYRTVRVLSNDPQANEKVLTIQADVIK